jgi:hypothetical protein
VVLGIFRASFVAVLSSKINIAWISGLTLGDVCEIQSKTEPMVVRINPKEETRHLTQN